MNTIRIIAGSLKGKKISFENIKFNDAEITPQKVKGAVFSIIGEDLSGKSFLDLYAGSGQIGIEAISRGADPVIINEIDKKKYQFIKSFTSGLDKNRSVILLNSHALEALNYFDKNGITVDYVFVDPPYIKVKGESGPYSEIIDKINGNSVLKKHGMIIVQHYSDNALNSRVGRYMLADSRRYGTTSLSIYRSD